MYMRHHAKHNLQYLASDPVEPARPPVRDDEDVARVAHQRHVDVADRRRGVKESPGIEGGVFILWSPWSSTNSIPGVKVVVHKRADARRRHGMLQARICLLRKPEQKGWALLGGGSYVAGSQPSERKAGNQETGICFLHRTHGIQYTVHTVHNVPQKMVRDVRKNVTQCPRMFMLLYTLSINVFKRRFVSPFLITNTDRALENEESARIFPSGFEHCSLVD